MQNSVDNVKPLTPSWLAPQRGKHRRSKAIFCFNSLLLAEDSGCTSNSTGSKNVEPTINITGTGCLLTGHNESAHSSNSPAGFQIAISDDLQGSGSEKKENHHKSHLKFNSLKDKNKRPLHSTCNGRRNKNVQWKDLHEVEKELLTPSI